MSRPSCSPRDQPISSAPCSTCPSVAARASTTRRTLHPSFPRRWEKVRSPSVVVHVVFDLLQLRGCPLARIVAVSCVCHHARGVLDHVHGQRRHVHGRLHDCTEESHHFLPFWSSGGGGGGGGHLARGYSFACLSQRFLSTHPISHGRRESSWTSS